jgi:hypothetical protein
VAELTCQQDGIFRKHLLEQLLRETMKSTANSSRRRRRDGRPQYDTDSEDIVARHAYGELAVANSPLANPAWQPHPLADAAELPKGRPKPPPRKTSAGDVRFSSIRSSSGSKVIDWTDHGKRLRCLWLRERPGVPRCATTAFTALNPAQQRSVTS